VVYLDWPYFRKILKNSLSATWNISYFNISEKALKEQKAKKMLRNIPEISMFKMVDNKG